MTEEQVALDKRKKELAALRQLKEQADSRIDALEARIKSMQRQQQMESDAE